MVKVSIIIPNYNHACFLNQRIESILNQTYQDFELIILDDHSPDNSREIIAQYDLHEKVSKIVFNKTNSGSTFKQWQKGIGLAKGEYIWIAESDDWCEPTLLETLMEGLLANKNTGLAFCQSCYYYEPNKIKETTFYPYYSNVEKGKDFIQNYMLRGNNVVNASMAVWKKELYHKIDLEYTHFKFCGDWLFWISLMEQADVFVSGKILNYFRNHDKDVSTRFYSTGNYIIETIDLYEILHERKLIDNNQLKSFMQRLFINFLGVKDHLLKSNLNNIYKAFKTNQTLTNTEKLYYFAKNKLHTIKGMLKLKLHMSS